MPLPHIPFYFIRHGQSESNAARIMAGSGIDTPLTDLGKTQADDAGKVLLKLPQLPQAICYSPMQRAAETAQIINHHLQLPMITIPDLREHFVGEWEGKPWSEVTQLWDSGVLDPPAGEKWEDFKTRVKGAMNQCLEHPHPVLIVAHGGVWQAMKMLYQMDNGYFELDNAIPHHFHPIPEQPLYPWLVHKLTLCTISGDLLKNPVVWE